MERPSEFGRLLRTFCDQQARG